MNQEHVDAGKPQSLQTVLDGAAGSFRRVVVDEIERQRSREEFAAVIGIRARAHDPPHLRRQDEVLARQVAEGFTETVLAQAVAVEGSGIEKIDAMSQRRRHCFS